MPGQEQNIQLYEGGLVEPRRTYDYDKASKHRTIENAGRSATIAELTLLIQEYEKHSGSSNTNATEIPSYMFIDDDAINRVKPLSVDIQENVDKYYCHLLPAEKSAIPHQDKPESLRNVIKLHLKAVIQNLKDNNHKLPVTIVYPFGMNNNHAGTFAVRINSFGDLAQNELLITNSYAGYDNWHAAIKQGVEEGLGGVPAVTELKPKGTASEIHQAPGGNACCLIAAAMACAIDNKKSFSTQKKDLHDHMRSLCGVNNEPALRQDAHEMLRRAGVTPNKPPGTPQFKKFGKVQSAPVRNQQPASVPKQKNRDRFNRLPPSNINSVAKLTPVSSNQPQQEVHANSIQLLTNANNFEKIKSILQEHKADTNNPWKTSPEHLDENDDVQTTTQIEVSTSQGTDGKTLTGFTIKNTGVSVPAHISDKQARQKSYDQAAQFLGECQLSKVIKITAPLNNEEALLAATRSVLKADGDMVPIIFPSTSDGANCDLQQKIIDQLSDGEKEIYQQRVNNLEGKNKRCFDSNIEKNYGRFSEETPNPEDKPGSTPGFRG